ncbi:MAG TPA: GNAT family N-acetyltransferase [Gaiellaceae bacterium]
MLTTERLLLRKPRLEDAEALLAAYSDPETMRYIGDGSTTDIEGMRAGIEKWLARWDATGIGFFVLEHDGVVVGRAGFLVWDPETWTISELDDGSEVELGWTLIREHWGYGYATEAAVALRDWTDRSRLISLIQHGNERSERVAERIGERYERDVVVRGVPTRLYSIER